MVRSRTFRVFPFFFTYLIWGLCNCIAGLIAYRILSPDDYLRYCLAALVLDALFECGFIFELVRSVLRHNPGVPPRPFLGIRIFLLAILFIMLLSDWTVPQHLSAPWRLYLHLQQASNILRIACVLTLLLWSSELYLRWSERQLHLITGLGCYSIVDLAVTIVQTHLTIGPLYYTLDRIMSVSFMWAMAYWILTFASKDPEPQSSLTRNALIASRVARIRKDRPCTVVEFQETRPVFPEGAGAGYPQRGSRPLKIDLKRKGFSHGPYSPAACSALLPPSRTDNSTDTKR